MGRGQGDKLRHSRILLIIYNKVATCCSNCAESACLFQAPLPLSRLVEQAIKICPKRHALHRGCDRVEGIQSRRARAQPQPSAAFLGLHGRRTLVLSIFCVMCCCVSIKKIINICCCSVRMSESLARHLKSVEQMSCGCRSLEASALDLPSPSPFQIVDL